MKNFLISTLVNLILILVSYGIFKSVISGPTRHKIYEKLLSSFAKFVVYIFLLTALVTGLSALILYKTRYIVYLNVIAPALVSILVGFVMSTVPTRGSGDKKEN
ncbi:hypothetical protein ACER0A_013420 [Haloimpatiens sp. FM7315]|uniref:hypothetical protein n=1 Tax=Haloimpatiens sp. FM7315 TaxID=3298609 RepID=UPI00370AA756